MDETSCGDNLTLTSLDPDPMGLDLGSQFFIFKWTFTSGLHKSLVKIVFVQTVLDHRLIKIRFSQALKW
jgi:hypothetical protein